MAADLHTDIVSAPTEHPASGTPHRVYVLDTSVLLSDPKAMYRFAEHEVVIPIAVLTELEAKRKHPELGYFARSALRTLDELRLEHGGLSDTIALNEEGGTLRVELNHSDQEALPAGFRLGDNDTRILAVAANLAKEGYNVCVVSKDLPMRIKAAAVGLGADEYRWEQVLETGWTGLARLTLTDQQMKALYDDGAIPLSQLTAEQASELGKPVINTGLIMGSSRGSALGRLTTDGGSGGWQIKLVRGDLDVFGVHGRSAEQRIAIDILRDPEVGIVSLGGRAGTGKSALALAAGLDAVLEQRAHRKVIVFRPLYAVGGQELGYLPGSGQEKMDPWAQAVFDTLGSVVSPEVIAEVVERDMLEVLPLTHIRGRSLHDAFVIVDEAQSLERNVLLTVLSRIGQNSRVVLTHDVSQRDNLRVGRYDGVAAVIEKLKNHPLFAHVTLARSERSQIAALVSELLEDLDFNPNT